MNSRFLSGIILLLLLLPVSILASGEIRLACEELELKVNPYLAGRVTSLRHRNGKNILYSAQIDQMSGSFPELVYNKERFQRFYGHVMWVGPQSEWWRHQEIEPQAKAECAVWPPDPYWEFSEFAVVAQGQDFIILKSPHSPFSGVTMTKNVQLLPGGKVALKTTLENTGNKIVKWGLWSNTRIAGDAVVYAWPRPDREFRFEFSTWEPVTEQPLDYEMDGEFIRLPHRGSWPCTIGGKRTGKLFIRPINPIMAAFTDGVVFIKKTEIIPLAKIAPGHCQVEIFGEWNCPPVSSFYELEFHGEYVELAPGQSTSLEETWIVQPAHLPRDDQELREFFLHNMK